MYCDYDWTAKKLADLFHSEGLFSIPRVCYVFGESGADSIFVAFEHNQFDSKFYSRYPFSGKISLELYDEVFSLVKKSWSNDKELFHSGLLYLADYTYLKVDGYLKIRQMLFGELELKNSFRLEASMVSLSDLNVFDSRFLIATKYVSFSRCRFDSALVKLARYEGSIFMPVERLDEVEISGCIFNECDLDFDNANSISIFDSKINGDLDLTVQRHLFLNSVETNGIVRLSTLSNAGAVVELGNMDMARIKLLSDESLFDFVVSDKINTAAALRMHKQLLSYFSDVEDLRMRYDVRYQQFLNKINNRPAIDWIQEHWNYYGYRKNLIFRNSFIIMAFFFLGNLLFYKTLLNSVYDVEKLKSVEGLWTRPNRPFLIRSWVYTLHCLIFTSYIFWGLKLDLQHLKHEKLAGSLWVIVQYLAGIVCLAYIANIIITK